VRQIAYNYRMRAHTVTPLCALYARISTADPAGALAKAYSEFESMREWEEHFAGDRMKAAFTRESALKTKIPPCNSSTTAALQSTWGTRRSNISEKESSVKRLAL
jgi:hypothetical protein